MNQGVGGAMVTGFKRAMKNGADVVVKMDGDGQMDPSYVSSLLDPLIDDGYPMPKETGSSITSDSRKCPHFG